MTLRDRLAAVLLAVGYVLTVVGVGVVFGVGWAVLVAGVLSIACGVLVTIGMEEVVVGDGDGAAVRR